MSSSSSSSSLSLDAEEDSKSTTTITTSSSSSSTAVLKGFLYNHFTKEVMAELPLTPNAQTTILSSAGNHLTVSVISKKGQNSLPSLRIEEREASDNIPTVVKAMQENRKYTLQKRKEDLKAVEEELAEIQKEMVEGKDDRAERLPELFRVKALQTREIKNLEKGLVEVKFKEFSVVSSVEVPAGSATKLEWFEEPVLWCPTMAKEVEKQEKDCTKMIDISKDYVAEQDRETFILGDGKLYAVGGHDGSSYLSSVERYDSKTNKWEAVASMGTQRGYLGVAVYGGHLYAVGGYDGSSWLSSVERYDSKTNKWEAVASMGTQRGFLGVAVYGGHLYAVGGYDGSSSLSSVERYDSKTNKWEAVASMGTQRGFLGVAVYGGHLYAVGGYDGSSWLSSVERYDSKTNKWEAVASMGTQRSRLGVAVY